MCKEDEVTSRSKVRRILALELHEAFFVDRVGLTVHSLNENGTNDR
jgi:hypothetical protein